MHVSLLSLAFNGSLVLTVFSFGLQAQKAQDLRFMLRNPRLLILSLLAMFIVTPALALAIALSLDLPVTAQVALVALSLSMIPPLLPKKELQSGGHASYAVGLVIVVAVLAPVGIPALVSLLGRIMDRPYGVSPISVAWVVLSLFGIAVQAGITGRKKF